MNMNTKVKNRRSAFTLLKDYVNSMIVSQELAKNICDLEVRRRVQNPRIDPSHIS